MKVEAASNDITECPHDDKPSIGTLCFLYFRQHETCPRRCFHVIRLSYVHCIHHVNYPAVLKLQDGTTSKTKMLHQDQDCYTETMMQDQDRGFYS